MKIIQLTAGTGNFYCGTCLRDHALIKGLTDLGHDATLVPMYLPLVTETPADRDVPLFFGGINVYLREKLSLCRHTPRWLDRLLDSRTLLRLAARNAGMTKARDLGELTLAVLQVGDSRQRKELDRLIDWLSSHKRPDVVCLSNALLSGFARPIQQALGVPVVCTLQGEDAFLDSLPPPFDAKCWDALRANVAEIAAFVAVSDYYGETMQRRLDIPAAKANVVRNGIDLSDFEHLDLRPAAAPTIGYLTQIIPGKGLERLIDAFLVLKQANRIAKLALHVAGSLVPAEKPFLARMKQKVADAGFAADLKVSPNIERADKLAFLASLSVLSVPATYGESFGLYVIEALAAGVPVVQPRHAAFPEVLTLTGGGILCEPDDTAALAEALGTLLDNPQGAQALGAEGRRGAFEHFGLPRMCREFVDILEHTTDQ